MRPRRPGPGAVVRMVAPSSPFDRARFEAGVTAIASMGLRPVFTQRVFEADGYLAGPDALRAADLAEALSTGDADVVMAARGGYGSIRILDALLRHPIRPVLFLGFSDLTAVHLLLNHLGMVSFHGPNVTTVPNLDPPSLLRLADLLLGRADGFRYDGLAPVRGGRAEGTLLVGNLSIISALWGTPYAARLAGSILVLEDTGEAPYRIDRMLTQLSMQAEAGEVRGIAFGDLSVRGDDALLVMRAIRDLSDRLKCPVVTNFPAGHGHVNYPVPVGVRALLDADSGTLCVLEEPWG